MELTLSLLRQHFIILDRGTNYHLAGERQVKQELHKCISWELMYFSREVWSSPPPAAAWQSSAWLSLKAFTGARRSQSKCPIKCGKSTEEEKEKKRSHCLLSFHHFHPSSPNALCVCGHLPTAEDANNRLQQQNAQQKTCRPWSMSARWLKNGRSNNNSSNVDQLPYLPFTEPLCTLTLNACVLCREGRHSE